MTIQTATDDLVASIGTAFATKLSKSKDTLVNAKGKRIVVANAMGNVEIDFNEATEYYFSPTGDFGFSFKNAPAQNSAETASVIISIKNGGARTITWGGIKFNNGVKPNLSTVGLDRLMILWDPVNNAPNLFVLGLNIS